MDDEFRAYDAGRTDGLLGKRDAVQAGNPVFGRDYRIGFIDGRIEVYRLRAGVRRIVEDPE
ncbi:hypothetical protein ODJ79_31030 [Actinoplanes sp. KI2]|uniref:hypothetical protein n=1 Tax=Actinoplanes sp. KI2 TaxID=2983315 RepID=UPI0021D5FE72|nr:hypothetical protein [Actinoplanes sp. KI2]MCU7728173.1 hypothetical protein [Actinoplanes sp. KI2]